MLLPSMPTRETTFLMMLVVGLGYGLLDIGPNMVVASLNRERASIALNLLNIMWGIGAALGPQVANLALNQKNINLAFILPGLLTLAMIPPFLLVSLPHDHDRQPEAQAREVRKKVRWSALLPFMLLMFAYVGAENGFGGWVFTELQLVTKSTESVATFANSLFWAGLTFGRIMASIVLRYISDEALILVGAVIVLVGALGFMLLPGIEPVAIIASFAIGVGCGPIFPTGLAVLNRRFPESRGAISGLVMSIGSLGAVAIPWLHGQVGRGLSGGLVVTVVLGAVMITLVLIIHRGKDEHPIAAPAVSPGADA